MAKTTKIGRPRSLDPRSEGVLVRLTPLQKKSVTEYLDQLNRERAKQSLPALTLASWAHAVMLRAANVEHLGAQAEAERLARSSQVL